MGIDRNFCARKAAIPNSNISIGVVVTVNQIQPIKWKLKAD